MPKKSVLTFSQSDRKVHLTEWNCVRCGQWMVTSVFYDVLPRSEWPRCRNPTCHEKKMQRGRTEYVRWAHDYVTEAEEGW